MRALGKSPRTSGGLMRSPRFRTIAIDRMMKLDDSVAMIGGIRSRRMSAKLKTPTSTPTRRATAIPIGITAASPSMILMAIVAGQDHRRRDREVDVPRSQRDDEHLADGHHGEEAAEDERGRQQPHGGLAARQQDGREPDRSGGHVGPDPGLGRAPVERPRGRRHRRLPASVDQDAERQDDDEDRALRADLPVGRELQERQQRAREQQRRRADDRAHGRDPPTHELAAAEDDPGDREQRVRQREARVGRAAEAEQRQAGERRRSRRPARTS